MKTLLQLIKEAAQAFFVKAPPAPTTPTLEQEYEWAKQALKDCEVAMDQADADFVPCAVQAFNAALARVGAIKVRLEQSMAVANS